MAVMLDKMGAMMVLPLLPFIARSNLVKVCESEIVSVVNGTLQGSGSEFITFNHISSHIITIHHISSRFIKIHDQSRKFMVYIVGCSLRSGSRQELAAVPGYTFDHRDVACRSPEFES